MATSASAHLHIKLDAETLADSPHETLPARDLLENAVGGERWTNGQGSGQIDRVYKVAGTLGAGATDNYNALAAGSLTDVYGQAIDLDELKGIVIRCLTGQITFEAPGASFLSCFKAAADGIVLVAGHSIGLSFGAGGIDVTANSTFDIDDSGGAGSTYELEFIGAN